MVLKLTEIEDVRNKSERKEIFTLKYKNNKIDRAALSALEHTDCQAVYIGNKQQELVDIYIYNWL